MQKPNTDPAQDALPDPVSRKRTALESTMRRITPQRLAVALLVFALLVASLLMALPGMRPSYASTNNQLIPNNCTTTVTPDPVCSTSTASAATATATASTPPPPPSPSPSPPPPPPPPTKPPTPKPRPSPTAVPTAAPSPSATASVSPTATSTTTLGAGGGGGTPGVTPTSGPSSSGGGGGGQTHGWSPLTTVLTILFVLVGLALALGGGWLLFRRVLMPSNETKLKPSGARPWSRTRVPNPSSQAGQAYASTSNAAPVLAANAAYAIPHNASNPNLPGFAPAAAGLEAAWPDFDTTMNNGSNPNMQGFPQNNGYDPNMQGFAPAMNSGYDPHMQGFATTMNNGFNPTMQGFSPNNGYDPNMQGFAPNTGYAPQGMNPYGQRESDFGNYADGFARPPSRVFSQSDMSMIPLNTGALPSPGRNEGYAPASPAFNAMYGLPDDPFAASQGGSLPNWLDNLTIDQRSGFGGKQPATPHPLSGQPPSTPIPSSGQQAPADPYMNEMLRQYGQQNQPARPPQTGKPNSDWAK